MKVLLIGATGNLGIRLVPALLSHGHTVAAFVRSAKKLETLLPSSIYSRITVFEGSAKDSAVLKKAILDSNCDAVVNTAGVAAVAPWGKSDLPDIFRAVLDAVKEAGQEKKKPLRAWFLAGQGILQLPGSNSLLSNYIPIYLQHRQNFKLIESTPPSIVDWSLLCPMTMVPESSDMVVPTKTPRAKLIASATTPPLWQDSWVKHIPLIGNVVLCGMNASRYETTLEENADLIAADLEQQESQWSCRRVGVIEYGK